MARKAESEATTLELLRAYHEHGDRSARQRLIELRLPQVRKLAARYAGRTEPLEDLVQVGSIGLINAIDRFELGRGVSLSSYAIPTIIGELKRHFRDRSWSLHVPRQTKELSLRLTQVVERLSSELGRSPSVAELAGAADAAEEDVLEALEVGRTYSTVPLPSVLEEDEIEADSLKSLGAEEDGYGASEDWATLSACLGALDQRERRIIHMRFFGGMTQSQIGDELDISQMHVSRLIRGALDKLRLAMVS